MKRNVFVLGVALFLVNGTYAQGFLDRLGNAAVNAAERAVIKRTEKEVDKAVNKAADKAPKSSYLPV